MKNDSSNASQAALGKGVCSELLGVELHDASMHGYKKKLKKILNKGVNVDYPNAAGQTALFCACFEGEASVIPILLKYGANANERCDQGGTPVHAAGYSGNPHILSQLIEAGGDLRLHDNKGRTVQDWAMCHGDGKKRRKMLEFIEKARYFAMTHSGRDLLSDKHSSNQLGNSLQSDKSRTTVRTSLMSLFKARGVGGRKLNLSSSVQSFGFGKIYFGYGDYMGSIATIPLVCEGTLRHDEYGPNYFNGTFMVMEGMKWNKTLVTVKRLHKQPAVGSSVDLLIHEHDYMARLRHPYVLLLMGICQTNNLEGLVLLYERVGIGSLFHYLHQRGAVMNKLAMCELLRQISDALLYLHGQNLIHCSITSHAVQMIGIGHAKINNFEYMVEKDSCPDFPHVDFPEGSSSKLNALSEEQCQHGLHNWLAPEIYTGNSATEKSDLYSLCTVMWEIIHGCVPWGNLQGSEIKSQLAKGHSLKISEKVKSPFNVLLQYGLSAEPRDRQLSVEQFRDIMAQIIVDEENIPYGSEKSPECSAKRRVSSSRQYYKSWRQPRRDSKDVSSDATGTSQDMPNRSGSANMLANISRLSKNTSSIKSPVPQTEYMPLPKSPEDLWLEQKNIIRQSQIPSGGSLCENKKAIIPTSPQLESPTAVPHESQTVSSAAVPLAEAEPVIESDVATAPVESAPLIEKRALKFNYIYNDSKRAFFQQASDLATTASMPMSKLQPAAVANLKHKQELSKVNTDPLWNTQHDSSNPFKQYHSEVVMTEIKAVLASKTLPQPKTALPTASYPRTTKLMLASKEDDKKTVYAILSNPSSVVLRPKKLEGFTDAESRLLPGPGCHAPVVNVNQLEVPPKIPDSPAPAINVSQMNRSNLSGSWTLSFDLTDEHSYKPASHRESTPINDVVVPIPKPHDFAWPAQLRAASANAANRRAMMTAKNHRTSPTKGKRVTSSHSSGCSTESHTSGIVLSEKKPVEERADTTQNKNHWFAGNGSVKELVRAFQGHVNEHLRKQATFYNRGKKMFGHVAAKFAGTKSSRTSTNVPSSPNVPIATEETVGPKDGADEQVQQTTNAQKDSVASDMPILGTSDEIKYKRDLFRPVRDELVEEVKARTDEGMLVSNEDGSNTEQNEEKMIESGADTSSMACGTLSSIGSPGAKSAIPLLSNEPTDVSGSDDARHRGERRSTELKAGYFTGSVRAINSKNGRPQKFGNISLRQTAVNEANYEGECTDMIGSRKVDAEIEDLYFDDELCGENVSKERHLRLQSPSADQLPARGRLRQSTEDTSVDTTNSIEEINSLQAKLSAQSRSSSTAEIQHHSATEVYSDDNVLLHKVLEPATDVNYYSTVKLESFEKQQTAGIGTRNTSTDITVATASVDIDPDTKHIVTDTSHVSSDVNGCDTSNCSTDVQDDAKIPTDVVACDDTGLTNVSTNDKANISTDDNIVILSTDDNVCNAANISTDDNVRDDTNISTDDNVCNASNISTDVTDDCTDALVIASDDGKMPTNDNIHVNLSTDANMGIDVTDEANKHTGGNISVTEVTNVAMEPNILLATMEASENKCCNFVPGTADKITGQLESDRGPTEYEAEANNDEDENVLSISANGTDSSTSDTKSYDNVKRLEGCVLTES